MVDVASVNQLLLSEPPPSGRLGYVTVTMNVCPSETR